MTDLDRAIASNRWEIIGLAGIALLAIVAAAPIIVSLGHDFLSSMQPRPAACEGLSAQACILLAQEGLL